MELIMLIAIAVLCAIGTYFLLTRSLIRVAIGTILISHGVHLLFFTLAGLREGYPPLVHISGEQATDPLPQALVLTAIVIGFGIIAFLIILAYRIYEEHGTEDLEQLRGENHE
ncbi:Na(+)/H(+) antiporter subunit C [Alkalihalobacillus pseudalcaliphilus]|uniref:Na(+)/H(+) antiporter subunit C n=1 Tax=Alkalihalobacillus pseudalcaliphilus TaxID=79884 RepID=UPI00064D893B|nr:Na(+)/H(+) antiporter subunit C [Alkalihalobacillus pseudalcaliphilus]KMK77198.1 monovalent cation/H+ antiporter subunit C [Alkalihalobacillus pseudalcaliphilus]